MEYQIGDIIKLKKPHPCGSQEWEILRVGARIPEESAKPEVCYYSELHSHLQIHS